MEDRIFFFFPLLACHKYFSCFTWKPHIMKLKSLWEDFLYPKLILGSYYVEQHMNINLALEKLKTG